MDAPVKQYQSYTYITQYEQHQRYELAHMRTGQPWSLDAPVLGELPFWSQCLAPKSDDAALDSGPSEKLWGI